ncbi:MAG: class I SAM-dependent methyltransferase [Thermodesulforhabdaceae bacterium]
MSIKEDKWFEEHYLRAGGLWDAVVYAISRIWSPPMPQKVLEVGCGSGRFLLWLYKENHTPYGVDPSKELLEKARKSLPDLVGLRQAPIEALPFEDKSFDTVFFVLSLEYAVDPVRALREAFRVARGTVVVVSFNAYSPYYWFTKLSAWVVNNPMARCRTIRQGTLVAMTELAAGVPLRISQEPAKWKNIGIGALILSPIIVSRFDFAQQIYGISPAHISPSGRFVPSPSSYGQVSIQNTNISERGAEP